MSKTKVVALPQVPLSLDVEAIPAESWVVIDEDAVREREGRKGGEGSGWFGPPKGTHGAGSQGGEFKPYIGVPADAIPVGMTVNEYREPTRYGEEWKPEVTQEGGGTIRGRAMSVDDERIGDTVYHMTTNIQGVQDSPALYARGQGGLGGDFSDRIVSMTVDRDIAFQLADDIRFVAQLGDDHLPAMPEWVGFGEPGREASMQARREWARPLLEDMSARAASEGWSYPRAFTIDDPPGSYGLKDYLTGYFNERTSHTGFRNPLVFASHEEILGWDPAGVGVVAIPRNNLRTGALLTDFDLDPDNRFSLQEVRLYGDVPLGGAEYHSSSDEGSKMIARKAWARRKGLPVVAQVLISKDSKFPGLTEHWFGVPLVD